jgi:uncharacterized protein YdeI (YjbR/CyaY-like superfamily)
MFPSSVVDGGGCCALALVDNATFRAMGRETVRSACGASHAPSNAYQPCNNGGTAWRWRIERWQAEIAELQRVLSGLGLKEECKWGKPCYTIDGKNVV